MKIQSLLGLVVLSAASLVASSTASIQADEHHKGHFEDCSKICADCMRQCEMNFQHCFKMVEAGKKEHARAMHLSADCAEFCAVSAKLTARQSELVVPACEACAKSCDACAAECEKFSDTPEMKACAAKCVECAKSCREMVKMMGHEKK